jgi:NADH:ubiquinone oxidoreductase subunit 6 (subunit J)
MMLATVLGYFFAVTCVIASIYVVTSRDLLRISIAFFIEIASVGGVLLSLNADYLALIVFAVGLIGTILVISFSSVIMGSLKDSLATMKEKPLTRVWGMLLGIGVGSAIGWAFLSAPILEMAQDTEPAKEIDVLLLGRMMLGEQLPVFEILAVLVLIVVIGAGLLLRKPSHTDVSEDLL